jgi:uncharacterized protein (TIGR03435 family)
MLRTLAATMLAALVCVGQNFEVATVKPGAPPGTRSRVGMMRGGPQSPDPGHFSCQNCTLTMLVTDALDVKPSQISGPSWMNTERFDITAKIPTGSSEEQVRVMEQNLLAERFKLSFHREKKEMPVYELVVGKSGLKFKEATGARDTDPASGLPKDKNDRPTSYERTTYGYRMLTSNGQVKLHADGETMHELAHSLWSVAGRPVIDATGLTGEYEFELTFAADIPGTRPASPPPSSGPPLASAPDGDAGPSLFSAVQDQLGLRLESKKGPVDTIVIDRLEKAPTEN